MEQNTEQFESLTGIQTIIKPTIDIEPIEFNSDGDEQAAIDIGKKPFVWMGDIQLDILIDFKLTSSTFLPTIKIKFEDRFANFDHLRFPNDDEKIKVFVSSKSEILRPIYLQFKITKFNRVTANIYQIEGVLDINRFLVTKVESFSDSTSYEVFNQIATLTKLGFQTNINSTDDSMTWINPGLTGMDFCKEVIKKSYRSDSSYMWAFVDFYYNLNFLDIEEQFQFDLSKQTGIFSGSLNEIQRNINQEASAETEFLYLTNDMSSSTSPNYFESYKVYNMSTLRSIKGGYLNRVKYYDWNRKDLLIFDIDTINDDKNVILKADDDEFLKDNIKHIWAGKNVNVHQNYQYADVLNQMNINEMQKVALEIVLPNPNFNIYRFMKIFIMIINQGMTENNPRFNAKISGEWIVSEIQFYIDVIDGQFKQKVRLVRKSLGFSYTEENDES
jgi:hypothetical protein